MENEGKNIDDLFRDGLGDYAEAPPPAIWGKLEQKLEGNRAADPGSPYRKYGYFGAVFLLLLLGVSVVRNIAGNVSPIHTTVALNKNAQTGAVPAAQTHITNNNNAQQGDETTPGNNGNHNNTVTNAGKNTSTPVNGNDEQTTQNGQNKTTSTGRKIGNRIIRIAGHADDKHPVARAGKTKNNHSSAKSNDEEGADNERIYNSAPAKNKITPAADPKKNDENDAEKNKVNEAPIASAKPAPSKPKVDAIVNKKTKQHSKPEYRWEAGVKAGYETGFNNDAARKGVISPYLQYNISSRWAVMLQPSVKSAALNSRRIGAPQTYHKINDSKVTLVDSLPVYLGEDLGNVAFWKRNYAYSESYDSIIKKSSIGGTYAEFELPVLLKYYINKKTAVYGGVNIIYSKLISVKENTQTYAHIPRTTTKSIAGPTVNTSAPPSIDSVFTYTSSPISNYTGPQYSATNSSEVRLGYMLGLTYEYNKRWLVDALIQQSPANANVQAGYNVNTALAAPYMRVTLGYKLVK